MKGPNSSGSSTRTVQNINVKNTYIQALRGLAIAAVVLIHCLPESTLSVVIRPFLNWSVAMFVFLSGLLTAGHDSVKGMVKRRLLKVVPPYLIWSAVYIAASQYTSFDQALLSILSGGASAQMYFILVYVQLVVLTPFLFRMIRTHRVLLYAITPISVVLWELAAYFEFGLPNLGSLFPMWLIFYLFGLEWKYWCNLLRDRIPAIAAVVVCSLFAQIVEGFLWNALGNYNMAITQLRFTNTVSSLVIISIFMLAPNVIRQRISSRGAFARLGDLSFGIFLCHMFMLRVVNKLLVLAGLIRFSIPPILWFLVLCSSALFVALCQRVFSKRALAVIGFV